MAWRRKEKTTANLVKDVISIKIEGASASTVNKKIICNKVETSPASPPFSTPRCNEGKRKSAAITS